MRLASLVRDDIACCSLRRNPRAEGGLKLLFLGDNGHHRPAERFRQIQPVLSERGIEIVYTDTVDGAQCRRRSPSTTA